LEYAGLPEAVGSASGEISCLNAFCPLLEERSLIKMHSSNLLLFDKLRRSNMASKPQSMPFFEFLNTSSLKAASYMRKMLSQWFLGYPAIAKLDLRNRFRSQDDLQHKAAYFELFLYQLLIRMGFTASVHPELLNTKKHPDFLVRSSFGDAFYLEAKFVSGESSEEVGARKLIYQLRDAIREIDCPMYDVTCDWDGLPKGNIEVRKLVSDICEWIQSISFNMVTYWKKHNHSMLPRKVFDANGAKLIITVYPKICRGPETNKGMSVIVESEPSRHWTFIPHIRSSIKKKCSKFGRLDLPLVIALWPYDMFINESIFLHSLFGDMVSRWNAETRQAEFIDYAPPGAWITKYKYVCTGNSAVIGFNLVDAWDFKQIKAWVFHHPKPKLPLNYNSELSKLTSYVPVDGRFEKKLGASPREILGLPKCVTLNS
jgi:hypothetical protein